VSRSVDWTEHALRQAERLDQRTRERIETALERLATSGHGDVRPLQGRPQQWRLRVGDWRLIFTYDDETTAIVILAVFPRGRAYR
jgi:mRNA interferase RelE/StbE